MRTASLLVMLALRVAPLGAQEGAGPDRSPGVADSGSPQEATAEPGSELRVWLLTAGPGDAVWERYGHNAIRVLDTRSGRDVSYNWGIFDFAQVDFIPRFLQGRMLYSMAVFPTEPMVQAYGRANREIVQQELALTPAQKLELRDFAEVNALPENRDYIYQYFLDNCSTRVRDLLDLVLDGALSAAFSGEPSGLSWRGHARRLSQPDPLVSSGLDVLLGTPADASISVWDEMFVPMTLRDRVRDLRLARADGGSYELVSAEEILVAADRPPEARTPASRLPQHLALGLLIAALVFVPGRGGRIRIPGWVGTAMATAWSLLAGVLGLLLVAILFTDHTFATRNENLFVFQPLSLALAAFVPLAPRGGKLAGVASTTAAIVVGVALVGLVLQPLPWLPQANANFFALALPPHLAVALRLRD